MKIALIGTSGYGETYLNVLYHYIEQDKFDLCGVIDPYAEKSKYYTFLQENNIPIYERLEDFYKVDFAPLIIISSPIQFHKEQTLIALKHGSHVLCEKPLCAKYTDAIEMKLAAKQYGLKLGVGFQWSFSDPIQQLKNDIDCGIFGKPLSFKTCISWQRPRSYYAGSTWKGRINDKNGAPIYDSIITNATAHYLHNMFFVGSSYAKKADYLLYKAYDIETFDTCIIQGTMENGCEFFYGVTHAGDTQAEPIIEYTFEKGKVIFDQNVKDELKAILNNGTEIIYGELQSTQITSQKVSKMMDSIENNTNPLCMVDDILPHLKLCGDIFENMNVTKFPEEQLVMQGEMIMVDGLWGKIKKAYDKNKMPVSLL